jgi:hypothetical protein
MKDIFSGFFTTACFVFIVWVIITLSYSIYETIKYAN